MIPSRSWRWLGAAVLLAGCSVSSEDPAPQKVEPTPAPAAEAESPAPAAEDAPEPLTEEELALIAADPADLTVEQRRKRAYARRKKIMQNPDSPTARALKDLAEAHRSGELDVGKGQGGMWFHAPGTKPTGGRPPAGYRPPEGDAQGDAAEPAPAPEAAPADDGAGAP